MTGVRSVVAAVASLIVAVFALVPAGSAVAAGDSATPQVRRGLVLAFDTTDSVSPQQFEAAKGAALELLRRLDSDVDVGLVTFDEQARVEVAPTADRSALETRIPQLETRVTASTQLYDGVAESLHALQPYSSQLVIMFTDGAQYEEPRPSADELMAEAESYAKRATDQGATISAVTIAKPDKPTPPDFTALVSGTDGTLATVADSDDLAYDLTTKIAELGTSVIAPVSSPTDDDLEPAVIEGRPTPQALESTVQPPMVPALPPWILVVAAAVTAVGAVFAGLALAGIAGRAGSPERRRAQALDEYTVGAVRKAPPKPRPPTRLGGNALIKRAVDAADRFAHDRKLEDRLALRLEAADLPLRPGEWLVVQIFSATALGIVLLILTLGNPIALIVGALLGAGIPVLFLRIRGNRRQKAFHDALPDALQLLASTLRVGYSLQQSVDTVVREGREPIRGEFGRATLESRLGSPIEDGLGNVADRVDSDDFRWVVMAIRIQREVGGNLAELLDTVGATMRERERLRRHVNTLSAEGRLSAWIVGGLPVVFAAYLLVARPSYLSPLVNDPIGIAALVLAGILFTVGVLGLRWATKVDL